MPEKEPEKRPLFALGQVVATPGALETLATEEMSPLALIARHVTGDWGELPEEDAAANEQALVYGTRIFSAYTLESGARVWVITEHDRSVTTLLLPSEY